MTRVTTAVRVGLFLGAIGCSALVSGCGAASTEPSPRPRTTSVRTLNDDPPNAPCGSGWSLMDGVWVCGTP